MEIVSGKSTSSSSSVSDACAESVSVNIMPSGMGVLLTGQGSLGKQSCKMDDRRGGGNGGPWKVPRTDAFACPELKMHMASDDNLIRNTCCGSSCLVSDGRLAVSPTKSNSNASDAVLFSYDNSSSIFCEGRILRNELVLSSGAGAVASAGTRPSVPFQLYHNKSAGMPSSFASMGREMGMGMGMGMVTAERPPFSPSQWRELEQQALIFKYMMAGVPVPSDLLLPIRKSLFPFTALVGSHRHPPPNLTAWSSFQMGYGGNVDAEPGRCRRTDGKKWRCSRDVVPDQKYCERHMHRGRHRGSRKPVEGHTATATASASTPNSAPILGRKNLSGEMSLSGDGNHFQQYPLHLDGGAPDTLNKDYRYVNGIKGEDIDHHIQSIEASGSSALSNEWRLASKAAGAEATPFSEFRINSNGSTSNHNSPSPQLTSLMGQHFGPISERSRYASLQEGVREEHPLRHFFDDWPRSSTDAWTSDVYSEERSRSKHRGSSTTQLSISIPKASHSSASNTSSPRGKLSLSPLKLAMTREGKLGDDILGDPIEMGLAVGMNMKVEERPDRQHNWIPIAWENYPMGMLGPLAEVLRSSTPRGSKPRLNLMDDINKSGRSPWVERGRQSPGSCIASSPTGVLQKTLGCVSDANSAATSKTDSSS